MTQETLTTAGITNPSTTTRAYKGVTSAKPPASGADMTTPTEFTTTEYTNASSDNATVVSQSGVSTSNYACMDFQFFIPEAKRNIKEFSFGVEARASDGYVNTYGWTLYLRNNATSTWDSIATVSGSFSYQLQSNRKTADIQNFIDSNGRIRFMLISNAYDANGNGPEMDVDYAYLNITYGSASLYGFPGLMPGGKSTGYIRMGAAQPGSTSSKGFPGTFPGGFTSSFRTLGALQKQVSASNIKKVAGVALANIKKIAGVAIANIKKFVGVDN